MEIQNTNGKYLIYDDGKVWSNKPNKFMKPSLSNNGYSKTCLYIDTNQTTYSIHRLVAKYYIPNPNNFPEVDHIDRDKTNNNVNNLRWISRSKNQINKPIVGKIPYRHICSHKLRKYVYWKIQIMRNNQIIYQKNYNITKYSLEEVVRIRNEKYFEFGIDIDDN